MSDAGLDGDMTRIDVSERLLESGGLSIERLPMLKTIADRLASHCEEEFRNLTGMQIYMVINDLSVGKIGQILDSYETRAVANVYHANEWESRLLLGLDRSFVFTLTEILFGGDGSEPAFDTDRAFTNIEMKVAQRAFDLAISSLQAAFAPVANLTFMYERTEARLEFAIAGRRSNLAVLARVGLRLMDRTGELFVVIPQQALNPLRQLLAIDLTTTTTHSDPKWTKKIERELHRTEVSMRALLQSEDLELGDIADWKIGQFIPLKSIEEGFLRLECEGQPIFTCELGRAKDVYTVRVRDPIDLEAEFIDDMMAQ